MNEPTFSLHITDLIQELSIRHLLYPLPIDPSLVERFQKVQNVQIIYDSKQLNLKTVTGSPQFVYIARKGNSFNGHSLAEAVLSSGNLFIGETEDIKKIRQNYPDSWFQSITEHPYFIGVRNTAVALDCLLKKASNIDFSDFKIVAVTGTNGKTSFVQIASQLYETLSQKPALKIGTLGLQLGTETLTGSHVTMPDFPRYIEALSCAQKLQINTVFLEATSHGLQEERLGDTQVDIAVFTNLHQDHLDYHKTIENYKNAKLKLFRNYLKNAGTAIINLTGRDSEIFLKACSARKLIGVGQTKHSKNFFSTYQKKFQSISFLGLEDTTSSLSEGLSGKISLFNNADNYKEIPFQAPHLFGNFQAENAACGIAALLALGYSFPNIIEHLKSVKGIPGRFERVFAKNSLNKENLKELLSTPLVFVDFAHTPSAVEKVLLDVKSNLRPLNQNSSIQRPGKIISIMGCGGDREREKRPLITRILNKHCDLTILTSDNPRTESQEQIFKDMSQGIFDKERVMYEPDRAKAIKEGIQKATKGDVVLILGKGHESYQIIGSEKIPFSDNLVAADVLAENFCRGAS